MDILRRAVIDVGTNSIKLLVADVGAETVVPLVEESEQTRLGAGFFETRRLQAEPIALTASAVANFAKKARELGALSVRVIATSAARDAVNAAELTGAIERTAGLKVEIISGEQEADWAFQGVNTDAQLAQNSLLLLDLGGGSTEFIFGQGNVTRFRGSFQLGTVRLLEKFSIGDPPTPAQLRACREWVRNFLTREVQSQLQPALDRELSVGQSKPWLIGTGGTGSILARMVGQCDSYERNLIDGMRISADEIQAQTERLWQQTLAERKKITGLPPNRADVILFGLVIFAEIVEVFQFTEMRISTRGLRFAAVRAPAPEHQ